MTEGSIKLTSDHGLDLMTMGRRLRHLRRSRGLTLAELGERVGRAPSALSLLENGRREPKFSVLEDLASALSVPVEELLRRQPPSRRAKLEITLEELQRDPAYAELGLPHLKLGTRVPTEVLEHLVKLAGALREQRGKPAATPEEARAANAELRAAMRERANYFEDIEQAARWCAAGDGLRGRCPVPGHADVRGQPPRILRAVRARPAQFRSVADRPPQPPDLRQEGAGRDAFAARGPAAGARALPAGARGAA